MTSKRELHLRIERENVETYGCETLTLCEFVDLMNRTGMEGFGGSL